MLTYKIEKKDGRSKYECLYNAIKSDIRSGNLKSGEKLPSKRSLSEHLGISVVTVEKAYDQLIDEGYLTSRERSGYYVALSGSYMPALSETRYEQAIKQTVLPPQELPEGWIRTIRKTISQDADILNQKPHSRGCAVLCEAIAEYLMRYRGINVAPRNIFICSGAQDIYTRLALLLGKRNTFGIEYPSYESIEQVYSAFSVQLEHLEMGTDGIKTEALQSTKAKVLHITPFDSYPTGVTASANKRREYLNWLQRGERWMIEDDYDSEFASGRKPLETLFAQNGGQNGRVIYLNTFSKSLSPSVRTGYMITPDSLIPEYEKTLSFYSCPVPVFHQLVIARYIKDGYFERHLNRCRRKKAAGKETKNGK